MLRVRRTAGRYERYDLTRSPLSQRPTQRDIATLVGETRDDLRRLINYKEKFIQRRQTVTGPKKKVRDLAYPEGRLRAVHERLKFHLNKVKQPRYLFSPRKNFSQRDNAEFHLDQDQYLTLDIKKFYPSTTDAMVRRWFRDTLGMRPDVAGILTHLSTIDGKVSFGSPLTPVLCSLVHRAMFDEIENLCKKRGLRFSVWVDDITISGDFVPGDVVKQIRETIRSFGLKSHDITFRHGNRPVFITGIGVVGRNLITPNSLHLRVKTCWVEYHQSVTDDEKDEICKRLLSHLGTLRYVAGTSSEIGRKAADQMNSLRQERNERQKARVAAATIRIKDEVEHSRFVAIEESDDLPF